jgi:outer membrane biosynthesis protein TonB
MNRTIASLLTGVLLSAMCLAQSSADMQAGASASQDTSVSANKSGAKAGSNASATASQETAVSGKNGQAQTATADQLQAGSTVQAELTKPVDARKNKKGDEVVARTTQDVKSNGQTVLPKGSKIVGHVTDVQARENGQQESRLGIAFERAILKNGTQVPMALTLQAIGSSQASAATSMDDAAMADDNMSGMAAGAGATGSGATRGALGGVASTGRVVNTTGGAAGSTLHGASSAGAGVTGAAAAGRLTSSSQGVVGLPGMTLSSAASSTSAVSGTTTGGSVISSTSSNVHLDSGTRMILTATGH